MERYTVSNFYVTGPDNLVRPAISNSAAESFAAELNRLAEKLEQAERDRDTLGESLKQESQEKDFRWGGEIGEALSRCTNPPPPIVFYPPEPPPGAEESKEK